VLGIGGENVAGFYSAMKYFESLDNDNNKNSCGVQGEIRAEVGDRRRDPGGVPRPVAVESGVERPAASTSTRSWPHRRASN